MCQLQNEPTLEFWHLPNAKKWNVKRLKWLPVKSEPGEKFSTLREKKVITFNKPTDKKFWEHSLRWMFSRHLLGNSAFDMKSEDNLAQSIDIHLKAFDEENQIKDCNPIFALYRDNIFSTEGFSQRNWYPASISDFFHLPCLHLLIECFNLIGFRKSRTLFER